MSSNTVMWKYRDPATGGRVVYAMIMPAASLAGIRHDLEKRWTWARGVGGERGHWFTFDQTVAETEAKREQVLIVVPPWAVGEFDPGDEPHHNPGGSRQRERGVRLTPQPGWGEPRDYSADAADLRRRMATRPPTDRAVMRGVHREILASAFRHRPTWPNPPPPQTRPVVWKHRDARGVAYCMMLPGVASASVRTHLEGQGWQWAPGVGRGQGYWYTLDQALAEDTAERVRAQVVVPPWTTAEFARPSLAEVLASAPPEGRTWYACWFVPGGGPGRGMHHTDTDDERGLLLSSLPDAERYARKMARKKGATEARVFGTLRGSVDYDEPVTLDDEPDGGHGVTISADARYRPALPNPPVHAPPPFRTWEVRHVGGSDVDPVWFVRAPDGRTGQVQIVVGRAMFVDDGEQGCLFDERDAARDAWQQHDAALARKRPQMPLFGRNPRNCTPRAWWDA